MKFGYTFILVCLHPLLTWIHSVSRGLCRPIMEIDIDPVYVKDDDVNKVRGDIHNKLCTTINKLYPGEIYGAQQFLNNWLLYPRTNRTRAALIVRGLDFDGKHVEIYDTNPNRMDNTNSERVVIKDLPTTIHPHIVLAYMKGFPQLTIRSKVIYVPR